MNVQQYFMVPKSASVPPDPGASFIMTFALGASDSITLPLVLAGTYDFIVDWGDGTSDNITTWNQAERVHSYSGLPAGDYIVTITGILTHWSFATVTTSRLKIKSVDQWGETGFISLNGGFQSCTNLISVAGGMKGNASNLVSLFRICTNLTSVPEDLFSGITAVSVDLGATFRQTGITSFPVGIFAPINVSRFTETFYQCPITTLPLGIFNGQTVCNRMDSAFWGSSLVSLPVGIFDELVNVTNFQSCFRLCASFTSIDENIFRFNTLVTSFQETFVSSGLTSIPHGIFRYNTIASNFNSTFVGVPADYVPDIWSYNPTVPTLITSCFRQMTLLETVHPDLFAGMTSLSGTNARAVFFGCSSLNSLSANLMQGLINVTSLNEFFKSCTSLTSIPSGFLNNLVNIIDFNNGFGGMFEECSSLSTIPTDLLNDCVNVIRYNNMFSGCTSLTVNVSSLVSGINMTNVITTNQMFYNCSLVTGNGQDLIDKPKAAGYTIGTDSGTGSFRTFFNCTSLTDFETITAAFKD